MITGYYNKLFTNHGFYTNLWVKQNSYNSQIIKKLQNNQPYIKPPFYMTHIMSMGTQLQLLVLMMNF